MNEADSKNAMASAEHFGAQLLPAIKWHEEQLGTEEEKLLWWATFLGYLGGLCGASLGAGALQAIEQITKNNTARLLSEKAH